MDFLGSMLVDTGGVGFCQGGVWVLYVSADLSVKCAAEEVGVERGDEAERRSKGGF
jgi:hypothetical protein